MGRLREAPLGSAAQVLKYLARYTHRVAIANRRLLTLEGDRVAFRYKDYRRGRQVRVMRLEAVEFMRRFLLHVLPSGFVRIRHYGLLANRRCKEHLQRCRQLLAGGHGQAEASAAPNASSAQAPAGTPEARCPVCREGPLLVVAKIPPARAGPHRHEGM